MLLSSNTLDVIELLEQYEKLDIVDKVRLSIHILEIKYVGTGNFDIDKLIAYLKNLLGKLDPEYNTTITNFAVYKHLLLFSSKYMELNYMAKKKFSVEMLFSIYEYKFDDEKLNKGITENINIYDYAYELNLAI